MLIKVCGIADAENARQVAALKPDMMGFIFYRPSRRNAFGLDPQAVRDLPKEIIKTGVFVDEDAAAILRTAREYGLDRIQLHGEEAPGLCRELADNGYKIIKAFGISSPEDLQATAGYVDVCDMFLFDTRTPLKGGSGEKFDHGLLQTYTGRTPFLLSGGIGPEDTVIPASGHPLCAGLDVNSRFETAPGHKDPAALARFIAAIRKTIQP